MPETTASPFPMVSQRRRFKASLVLISVWLATAVLHWFPITQRGIYALAAGMVIYAIRLINIPPFGPPALLDQDTLETEPIPQETTAKSALSQVIESQGLPMVSLMVPAKNEESVIPELLACLQQLDYPEDRWEIWAIDDGSTDGTLAKLRLWQDRLPQLRIHHRPDGSIPGKSAALNEVLPLTSGEIIGVFDADALVPTDLLKRSLAIFEEKPNVAALQVRKAIANSDRNFWTRNQRAEMALDSYFQQQRRAIGGIGELRGNGQLVLRSALEAVGGWNEATITDDLDLTLRLHLLRRDVAFLANPAVLEEGVVRWGNLWPQRTRWAEGGYQRYLDYWPGIVTNDLGLRKTLDLAIFFLMQYLLPVAAIPDALLALILHQPVALWPLTVVSVVMSFVAMWQGLYRSHQMRGWELLKTTAVGTVYMLHWIPVMIVTTAKMCVRAQKFNWVKTLHVGDRTESLNQSL